MRDAISGRGNASQLVQFNSRNVSAISRSVLVEVRHVIREGSDSHHAISASRLRPQSDDAAISSLERVQRSTPAHAFIACGFISLMCLRWAYLSPLP